ncbi:MAG TPA: glycosyltransferase family 4 protein [Isosphaeraceae bacterium]|nr:glycosyltransferase family 4 protein [Isosphaeraceae bacterium]
MGAIGPEVNAGEAGLPSGYWEACRLAQERQYDEARRLYAELEGAAAGSDARLRCLIRNDLAVLAALEGRFDEARQGWSAAREVDPGCLPARLNDALIAAELDYAKLGPDDFPEPFAYARAPGAGPATTIASPPQKITHAAAGRPIRVAVLSFLFNWPASGGGNVHTVELARFLARAGYDVLHVYARYHDWGIGNVTEELPGRSEALEFDAAGWRLDEIVARYRRAVEGFDPDCVLITDAWNMKPLLAAAVQGYPFFLRFQALECLCPLNNLRLLARSPDQFEQCPRHQLATPEVCQRCLAERGAHSGALHQLERALAGVGMPEYDQVLRWALQEAEAVLVLNPLIAALLEPYARRVRVVPWGMDPARFPWPPPEGLRGASPEGVATLFMAAVQGETIKGFHVAHAACRLLRQSRSDFELVVTFDPPGRIDEFTRSVGWCSQAELPCHYRAADICLVPTIAQEGLSRTSVEAMAAGIPVVASRIGGLPFTVSDGTTGLLCEPGDPADLARQIARLLDDPPLRRTMGLAGRRRFEEAFTWESVIESYYRPLLARRAAGAGLLGG